MTDDYFPRFAQRAFDFATQFFTRLNNDGVYLVLLFVRSSQRLVQRFLGHFPARHHRVRAGVEHQV